MALHPELPLRVESREGSRALPFTVRRLGCLGYSGRQHEDVERHVQELARVGIQRPRQAPAFTAVGASLATVDTAIEVQGPFTSGEVEAVLLFGEGGPWVTVGSDHTDRFLERQSPPAAKQVCPKVLAATVWPLAEVEPHWDELVLRSWVRSGRRRRPYQEAALAATLPPAALAAAARRRVGRVLEGLVLFAGTVPIVDGELVYGDAYELALDDPRLGRVIRAQYAVHVLERGA